MLLLEKLLEEDFVNKINGNVTFDEDGGIVCNSLEGFTEEEVNLVTEKYLALEPHKIPGQYVGINIHEMTQLSDSEHKSIQELRLFSEVGKLRVTTASYHDTRFSDVKIILVVSVDSGDMHHRRSSLKIEPIKMTAENYCLQLKYLLNSPNNYLFVNFQNDNLFSSFIVLFKFKDEIQYENEIKDLINEIDIYGMGSELDRRFAYGPLKDLQGRFFNNNF